MRNVRLSRVPLEARHLRPQALLCARRALGRLLLPLALLLAPAGLPAGQWFAGDFHVHSTGASLDTDDVSFPEAYKAAALERGLQFLVLTDHSDATGGENSGPEFVYWEKAKALSEPGEFVMVCGSEISPLKIAGGAGHVLAIPRDLASFNTGYVFVERPEGEVPGGEAVRQAQEAGGLAVVAHPYSAVAPWIEYDWTSFEYDGLEVYNGGLKYDKGDWKTLQAWWCDLSQKRRVFGVGGSDVHRVRTPWPGSITDGALGFPKTYVYAEALSWPALVEGLTKGRVVVADWENFLELSVQKEDGKSFRIGDTVFAQPGEHLILRVEGKSRGENEIVVAFVPYGSCQDSRQKNRKVKVAYETLAKLTVAPKEPYEPFDLYHSFNPAASGVLMAVMGKIHRGKANEDVAITNPIYIELY